MDIKLKAKLWKAVKITAAVLAAAYLCYSVIRAIDIYGNGLILNWFTMNYTHSFIDADGIYYYLPNWDKLKMLVIEILVVLVEILLAITWFVSRRRADAVFQSAVTSTARMIRSYMTKDVEAEDIFPKEYAEVAAQMTQIKATMQSHEQALKDEESRKNDLIVYLAHDLKTPLTAVIGYLSLLEEAPDMPAAQRARYVHITLDKALRLEKLISEFFEITRYNLQELVLEPERIDLNYMLVQMADEFYPILQAHGNKAVLQLEENLTLYADPDKLARVFHNILKNAVVYSYPDTPVIISAAAEGETVRVTFENRGRTIPEAKLDIIFEKFFRLDEARATGTGGAGLGLAIARDIVTQHGGTITAKSADERTVFAVTLPVG